MAKVKNEEKAEKPAETKAVSPCNLTSSSLMNPDIGNVEEFKKYNANIYECFSPKDDLEIFFVNRAISCMWRLKRVVNIEEAIFSEEIHPDKGPIAEQIFAYIKDKMMIINKYEKSLEQSLFITLKQIKKLQDR